MPSDVHVCLVGSTAAGKTTFLAGLDVLSAPDRDGGVEVQAGKKEVRDRLRRLGQTIRSRDWPPPTVGVEVYPMTVTLTGRGGTTLIDLTAVDYPGELAADLDSLPDTDLDDLRRQFRRAEYLFLLLDPAADLLRPADPSPAVEADRLKRQAALLTAVQDVWRRRQGRGADPPTGPPGYDVAVVLTKADLYPGLTDPRAAEAFAAEHAPELMARLRRRCPRLRVFPLSAVGGVETVTRGGAPIRVPVRPPNPRGYRELFEWVAASRRRRRLRRRLAWLGGAAAVLVAVASAVTGAREQAAAAALSRLQDGGVPAAQRLSETRDATDDRARTARRDLFRRERDRLADRVEAAGTAEEFNRLREEVKALRGAAPGDLVAEADGLADRLARLWGEKDFLRADAARAANAPAAASLFTSFVVDHPSHEKAAEARRWLDQDRGAKRTAARKKVRDVVVGDRAGLENKVRAVREYLKDWGRDHDPAEADRMTRAADLGKQFLEPRDYRVTVGSSGTFTGAYYQRVVLVTGATTCLDETAASSAASQDWNRTVTVRWQAGDALRVELHGMSRWYSNTGAAVVHDPSVLGLLKTCNGRTALNKTAAWEKYFADGPFVTFELDLPAADVRLVEQYVHPGDAW